MSTFCFVTIFAVNFSIQVIDVSAMTAAAGLTVHGAGQIVGMLGIFSAPKIKCSHFFLQSMVVLLAGLTTVIGSFMRNEV